MIKSVHYYQRYIKFIDSCKERQLTGYTENHHIIPKSLGGSDSSENLVKLSARQHFLAHLMLWKTYDDKQMHDAFWLMCHMKSNNQERIYKINSRVYDRLKEQRRLLISHQMAVNNPSVREEVKELRRIAAMGNTHGKANKGVRFTEEHRKNLSNSHKGNPTSDNQKRAVSESNKKRKGTNPSKKAVESRQVKCYCEGVVYNTISEAQNHYKGICNIWKRLDNPKYPNFYRLKKCSM
jgi:hypothetical protein